MKYRLKYYLLIEDEDLKAYLERHADDIANEVEDYADLKQLFKFLSDLWQWKRKE